MALEPLLVLAAVPLGLTTEPIKNSAPLVIPSGVPLVPAAPLGGSAVVRWFVLRIVVKNSTLVSVLSKLLAACYVVAPPSAVFQTTPTTPALAVLVVLVLAA